MGWMVSAMRPNIFNSQKRDPGIKDVGAGLGVGAQILALTGVRTRSDTAPSESLYRLRYSSL